MSVCCKNIKGFCQLSALTLKDVPNAWCSSKVLVLRIFLGSCCWFYGCAATSWSVFTLEEVQMLLLVDLLPFLLLFLVSSSMDHDTLRWWNKEISSEETPKYSVIPASGGQVLQDRDTLQGWWVLLSLCLSLVALTKPWTFSPGFLAPSSLLPALFWDRVTPCVSCLTWEALIAPPAAPTYTMFTSSWLFPACLTLR